MVSCKDYHFKKTIISNTLTDIMMSLVLFILTILCLAPDGFPNITSSSSVRQGEIFLEWSLIPENQRNGLITRYIVQYMNSTLTINQTVSGPNALSVSYTLH